jgi:hypothetical protein
MSETQTRAYVRHTTRQRSGCAALSWRPSANHSVLVCGKKGGFVDIPELKFRQAGVAMESSNQDAKPAMPQN